MHGCKYFVFYLRNIINVILVKHYVPAQKIKLLKLSPAEGGGI